MDNTDHALVISIHKVTRGNAMCVESIPRLFDLNNKNLLRKLILGNFNNSY